MGFLDGISSNSPKKIKEAELEKEKDSAKTQEENPEDIDVFGAYGEDKNNDGIGDNIQLNSDNVEQDDDGNYYVEVDSKHNNSLYKIMENTYEGFYDLSQEEQDELINEVMNANPEIYGTETNDVSNQWVTDNDRSSLNTTSGNRSERMNTIIYSGDKIIIPTKTSKINNVTVQNPAENGNEGDSEHVHVGTVIATPHGSQSRTYSPDVSEVEINEDTKLGDIVKNNFEGANDNNVYSIALNQAKANSELVLERVNAAGKEQYDDVADIPADVLLETDLYDKDSDKKLSLVDSYHEDFKSDTDLTSTKFIDQETFTPKNFNVRIDPNIEESDPENAVYKSLE